MILALLSLLAFQASNSDRPAPFTFALRVQDDRGRLVPMERLFGEAELSVRIDEVRSRSTTVLCVRTTRVDGLVTLEHPAEPDFLGRECTLDLDLRSVREGEIDRYLPQHIAGRTDFLHGRLVHRARFFPGENSLPDLVLQVPPVLVRGRVLDPQGAPQAGALVRLSRAPPGYDPFLLEPEVFWSTNHTTQTDEAGRFELRGLFDDAAFVVQASHAALGKDRGRVIARGGSVVFEGILPSVIRGSVIRDDGDVDVELTAFAAHEDGREFGSKVGKDGSFEIRGVPPGKYRVGVYPAGPSAPR